MTCVDPHPSCLTLTGETGHLSHRKSESLERNLLYDYIDDHCSGCIKHAY